MTSSLGGSAGPAELTVAVAVLMAAGVALFGSRRTVAVVGLLVFGALLSLYWALIGAPDVALAEAAIGTGVTGALFVATVTALGRDDSIRPSGLTSTTVGLVIGTPLAVVIGLGLTRGVAGAADQDGAGLGAVVQDSLPDTGVAHPVTGVLLSFRSLDTLMEMVVLLAAVAVALIVLPEDLPARRSEARDASRTILDHFARISAPVLILLASWLLVAGSSRPGGAFQSGAVLAATLILLHLGGVWRLHVRPMLLVVLAGGVAAFLAVAVAGLLTSGSWLELRGPTAGPVILALEAVLALTIGASLATVFLAASSPIRGRPKDVR